MPEENINKNFETIEKRSNENLDFESAEKKELNEEEKIENIEDNLEEVKKKEIANKSSADKSGNNDEKIIKEIEGILANDCIDEYKKMSKTRQLKFKEVGELIAKEIKSLLYNKDKGNPAKKMLKRVTQVFYDESKYIIKQKRKINKLVKKWLLISPDIDNHYAEQMARIKSDKIIKLSRDN